MATEPWLGGITRGRRLRTRAQRIEDKAIELEAADQLAAINKARDRGSMFDDDPELVAFLDKHAAAALSAAQSPHRNPLDPVFGPSAAANAVALADARANRSDWRSDGPPVELPPAWVRVHAAHPEAGVLRLRCDGVQWVLDLRGAEYGCGSVGRGERRPDGTLVPRAEVVEAAGRQALADPSGPEQPPGTPVFYGDGRGGETTEPPPLIEAPAAKTTRRRRYGRAG